MKIFEIKKIFKQNKICVKGTTREHSKNNETIRDPLRHSVRSVRRSKTDNSRNENAYTLNIHASRL